MEKKRKENDQIHKGEQVYKIILIISIILLITNIIIGIQILNGRERIVTSVNMTNNLVEIVKEVKPAVVRIISETNQTPDSYSSSEIIKTDTGWTSYGTGFFIKSDGHIATANHVIDKSDKITVIIFKDGRVIETKEAKIIRQNPKTDTAVIKVDKKECPYLEIREYNEVNEGEEIGLIGFPLGVSFPMINKGIISSKNSLNMYGEDAKMFTINSFINPGNSGGPLISLEDGKAIGIINAKFRVVPQNLYIPPINLPKQGGISLMGIDFGSLVGVTIETRNLVLETLEKSSNVGIGFSTSIDYIKGYS